VVTETPPTSNLAAVDKGAEPPGKSAAGYRPFGYLADPICIGSILIYMLTRWVLKPHHIGGCFVHGYLNDLICLPLFLPIILRAQSILGIRRHDLPPTLFEVLHNWVIFSVVFEVVLPRIPAFASTGDPWDCVAYMVGGIAAYFWWNRRCGFTTG
jgi:hypothetical protein